MPSFTCGFDLGFDADTAKCVEASLFLYLQGQSTITDLVSNRIYPVRLPRAATLPAVSYRRITGGYGHLLDGGDGSAAPRFQVDVWANSYGQAKSIAEALRQVMQGFCGKFDCLTIHSVILENESDHYEQPTDASDEGIYHIALDYFILHEVSIPTFS